MNLNIIFRTSNKLKRDHLLVIEFERPIFGFEGSNIELGTLFDPSLQLLIINDFTKFFTFFFAEWYETGEACQNAGNCSKRGPDMYWHMFTRKISKDSTKAEAGSTSL